MNHPSVTNVTKVDTQVTQINQWYQNNDWQDRTTINSNNWNGRPWWYRPDYGEWHHGHWHGQHHDHGQGGWGSVNSSDHEWPSGLVAWRLGNLAYRSGYQAYANPYHLRPVTIGTASVDYSRPICVQQSRSELAFAKNEAQAEQLRQQALAYFERARRAFYLGQTDEAYDDINRAVALMPDDTVLHEFRALVLFSIGKYGEAAEVMHAVLAVAPGWDWTTLSGLYPDQDVYIAQLRALEQSVRLNPREPAARFLLAYQ